LKIQLCKDSVPSHRIKATRNFLLHNTPDFVRRKEWKTHSKDLNPLRYSVWDTLHNLSVKESVNHLRTQRSSECYLRQMAWCRRQTARIRKAMWQWEKRLAAVAKKNGGPI